MGAFLISWHDISFLYTFSSLHICISALRTDTENMPLQLKLDASAQLIAEIGSAAGLAFLALMISVIVQVAENNPVR